MDIFGKTAVFPGGFGRIGEIPHGRIWPDWGTRSNQVRRCLVGVSCEGNAILSFSYATYAPDPSITLKFSSFNYNMNTRFSK